MIGYLHTGFEKTMEHKTYWKGITYPERIDYLSFQANELVFVLAIEKLLALETPEKATWMRMCLAELNRIHSHLVWLGTSALEIGAISMFWYAFRERDMMLDLFEMVTGVACTPGTSRSAGSRRTSPRASTPRRARSRRHMPKAVDDYEGLLDRNKIWLERTKGIGLLSADDALALGQSGPMLRASGVDWDLRRATPYLAYDEVDFDVPVYPNGDVYDRYKVHMDEMRKSARIVTQCLDRLEEMRGEPWIADDRKVVLPPREELHTSMESLIHHFKIVTEGYLVPEGEVYVAIESARGEYGCYLVSDGGPKPWRVKFRAPSFAALQATATCVPRRRDRRHGRGRGLARPGHGRRRPVSATLYDEVQELRARATRDPLSAVLPALQLAQERQRRLALGGGVPRGRRRARPDAGLLPLDRVVLRHVPARARRRAPGRGLHQRLVRAQRARSRSSRRSRASSAIEAGETTEDGLHAAHGRVPRRLRLGDDRRRQQPPSAPRAGRATSRDRRGAAR